MHDGNGRPAGQRPGFLLGNATNEQIRVDAYTEYRDAIQAALARPTSTIQTTAGVRQSAGGLCRL